MIPSALFFKALAFVTFGYCVSKSIADFRMRRWAWGALGVLIALAVPATILIAEQGIIWLFNH